MPSLDLLFLELALPLAQGSLGGLCVHTEFPDPLGSVDSGFSQCPAGQMNKSLVNFMGRHYLPVHFSAQPPVVLPGPSPRLLCAQRKPHREDVPLGHFNPCWCTDPSIPTFLSPSQDP